MALIQLKGESAQRYRDYLEAFRTKFNREPGAAERTEAFFCARSTDNWNQQACSMYEAPANVPAA